MKGPSRCCLSIFEWLDAWMIEWLNDWMIGWLDDWMIEWLNGWMVGWLDGWMIEWLNDWTIEWLNEWMVEWLNDWMIEWLNDWMIKLLNECISEWLTLTMAFLFEDTSFLLNKILFHLFNILQYCPTIFPPKKGECSWGDVDGEGDFSYIRFCLRCVFYAVTLKHILGRATSLIAIPFPFSNCNS